MFSTTPLQKSILIASSLVFSSLALINTGYARAKSNPVFTITNNSSFYLNNQPQTAGCPSQIAPGQQGQSSQYWCGFVACATSQYDPNQGCMEWNGSKNALTQGGYATWFSLTPSACSIPAGNTYQCSWNNQNFNLSYASLVQTYSAGPNVGQPVMLPKTISTYATGPAFRGINISGMEYDGTFLDALFQHPDIPDARYFAEQGMNTVRLPIRWEFLVDDGNSLVESHNPTSSSLNTMYIAAVQDTLQKYLENGLTVVLDLHNYMRFCSAGAAIGQSNEPTDPVTNNCQLVTGDQLAYIWGQVAKQFAPLAQQYPKQLTFELMNEPFTMDGTQGQELSSQDLLADEVKAVNAIRANNITNLILLDGNYWDPLHGWVTGTVPGDQPNGDVFTAANLKAAGISDLSNIAIDMHQYFDADWSGRSSTCQTFASYNDFQQKLALTDNSGNDIFGNWIKANGMKVFLGEFGAADNPTCQQDINYMLQYVNTHAYNSSAPNNGGFIGWTAWRANRHGGDVGFSPFNFLQAADYNVYAASGSESNSQPGTGIAQGLGNGLMADTFAQYLTPPTKSK